MYLVTVNSMVELLFLPMWYLGSWPVLVLSCVTAEDTVSFVQLRVLFCIAAYCFCV